MRGGPEDFSTPPMPTIQIIFDPSDSTFRIFLHTDPPRVIFFIFLQTSIPPQFDFSQTSPPQILINFQSASLSLLNGIVLMAHNIHFALPQQYAKANTSSPALTRHTDVVSLSADPGTCQPPV